MSRPKFLLDVAFYGCGLYLFLNEARLDGSGKIILIKLKKRKLLGILLTKLNNVTGIVILLTNK